MDAGKEIPFVDRVIQYAIDDATTSWMKFLNGELDVSSISRDNWDAVITPDKALNERLKQRGVQLVSAPTLDLGYIGFNWDDPILVVKAIHFFAVERNRKLRQALSCAFDFDQLNQSGELSTSSDQWTLYSTPEW